MTKTERTIRQSPRASRGGFTLIELLVVVAVIAILAGMLLPALAKAKTKAQGILCMSNTKQLCLAWIMYAGDHNGTLVHNTHGSEAQGPGNTSRFSQWVQGWLDWTTSYHNTNLLFLTDPKFAKLAPYSNDKSGGIYKCPADKYLSAEQRARKWTRRVRSVSMNANMGEGNDKLWYGTRYHQIYLRDSDILRPPPSKAWVFVDEHPDSINDACFFTDMARKNAYWQDLSASYHNGACGYAFADGHSEIKRWIGPGTKLKVKVLGYGGVDSKDPRDMADFFWHQERTSAPAN
jgi:prepilin-type N-terminal cleavage/methylation domain-containing protein/prepilin-type processing-associated H-X9-DG protein